MQRQHTQPRVEQPLDQQPVRPLDRDQPDLQPHQHTTQPAQALLVMRERRGQLADSRHLLGLAQVGLQLPQLRDIPGQHQKRRAPAWLLERCRPHQHRPGAPFESCHLHFERALVTPAHALDVAPESLPVRRREEL